MSRRRGSTNAVIVIYWRDIPAQVTAGAADRASGQPEKILLDDRFQRAIDQAAVIADCTDTTSYVAQWRRTTEPLDGDAAEAARLRAASLEAAFTPDRLERLVSGGGRDPAGQGDESVRKRDGENRS
ncbi:MAG: virulence factor [Acidimicrobiia bacterium]|nr:virulence factor [Acidimicrobiia bacterium]